VVHQEVAALALTLEVVEGEAVVVLAVVEVEEDTSRETMAPHLKFLRWERSSMLAKEKSYANLTTSRSHISMLPYTWKTRRPLGKLMRSLVPLPRSTSP